MKDREIEEINIGKLFSDYKFKIPDFQREYAWTKEQIEDLFDDIANMTDSSYFLGPMVFKLGIPSKIIDGQQRLATISLIFAIIQDIIHEEKSLKEIKNFDKKLNPKLKKLLLTNNQLRLKINSQNVSIFESLVKNVNEPMKKILKIEKKKPKTSNLNLLNGYKFLYRKFKEQKNKINKEIKNSVLENQKIKEDFTSKISKTTEQISTQNKILEQEKIKYKNTLKKTIEQKIKKIEEEIQNNTKEVEEFTLKKIDIDKKIKDIKNTLLPEYYAFLKKFVENLISFNVIIIEAEARQAHQVFETLNERGKPLAQSDLLKNFLLMLMNTDDEEKEIMIRWNDIQKNILPHKLDDFFITFSRSMYGKTTSANFYRKFKQKNNNQQKVIALTKQLLSNSLIYKNMIQPTDKNYWSRNEILVHLESLKSLRSVVFYPIILLAKNKNWKNDDLETLIENCVALFVRYKTIGGGHAGGLDRLTTKVCEKIRDENAKLNEIKSLFMDVLPTNSKFISSFKEHEIKENEIASYILKQIYKKKENDSYAIPKNFELEHIIPESVFHNWAKPEGDQIIWKKHMEDNHISKEQVYRLGNMGLLSSPDNKKCRDHKFSFKIKFYKKYTYWNFTKNIKSEPTDDNMKVREESFGKIASSIWKID